MFRRRSGIGIDMTPMCDVAFLLLIFFMTTTQFKSPEPVAVALPTSRSEAHVPETTSILLTVSSEGAIYISGNASEDAQKVDKENVVGALKTWRERLPDAPVVLKGDKGSDCGTISDVMRALAETETPSFNLMTDIKQKKL
jgi:biopolymer transport protein ExbD